MAKRSSNSAAANVVTVSPETAAVAAEDTYTTISDTITDGTQTIVDYNAAITAVRVRVLNVKNSALLFPADVQPATGYNTAPDAEDTWATISDTTDGQTRTVIDYNARILSIRTRGMNVKDGSLLYFQVQPETGYTPAGEKEDAWAVISEAVNGDIQTEVDYNARISAVRSRSINVKNSALLDMYVMPVTGFTVPAAPNPEPQPE
jgi:hypothetical protein